MTKYKTCYLSDRDDVTVGFCHSMTWSSRKLPIHVEKAEDGSGFVVLCLTGCDVVGVVTGDGSDGGCFCGDGDSVLCGLFLWKSM